MKSVIFRVDAGRVKGVSLGHAVRAMTLGLHFLVDHLVYFVMRDYPEGVDFVRGSGFQVISAAPDLTEERILLPVIEERTPALVITDLPSFSGEKVFSRCREMSVPTAAFDIRGELAGRPDLVVNASAVPSFTAYPHLNGASKLLVGPKYHVLRDAPETQHINEKVWNVLLTLGGSDPADLTIRVMEALGTEPFDYALHVVLGPAYPDKQRIYDLADACRGRVVVQEIPEDFIGLLSRADIVITACGQTLYECAALGRPTIMLPTISHEEEEAAYFEKHAGFMNVGRWTGGASAEVLRWCVKELLDPEPRIRMHESGQRIVDREGSRRVADRLRAMLV